MTPHEPIRFTIVIPTYNREQFILATLESVFKQKYQNYEIIVVDNCSTDNTEAVLKPLVQAGKINFIKHDRNYERAKSRNTGMEHAKGDFLTFLDSDDFMYPDCLQDAADFVARNPQTKFFHNYYELVDENRKPIRQYPFPDLTDQRKAIANGNFLSCIGNFIHRDIYRRFRFETFPELTGVEDWEFWMQVVADHKLDRIEKINCAIQHHPNRTVNTGSVDKLKNGLLYLINKYRTDKHLSAVYSKYIDRIEASCYQYLAVLSNSFGLHQDAMAYLKIARAKDRSILLTSRYYKILRRAVLRKA